MDYVETVVLNPDQASRLKHRSCKPTALVYSADAFMKVCSGTAKLILRPTVLFEFDVV
jgi:hypothetical protein